jgi:hypothetical protein
MLTSLKGPKRHSRLMHCCKNTTVVEDRGLTIQKREPLSLARSSNDRASFARLSVDAGVRQQATKKSIDKSIGCLVQRTRESTHAGYQHAKAARQSDETAWLLVRVMRYLTPMYSRSDLADLYAALQQMDADDLSRFAKQYGWRATTARP